jgi:hypothetical protein
MGKGTKVVAQEGTGSGTSIFYKHGYGDGYYSTLPIGYPLPSLFQLHDRSDKQLEPVTPPVHGSTGRTDRSEPGFKTMLFRPNYFEAN